MKTACMLMLAGLGLAAVTFAQSPSVLLTPAGQQIMKDSLSAVRIHASTMHALHAYNVRVVYDPLLVRCRSVKGMTFLGHSTFLSILNDSIHGEVTVTEAILGPGGVSGSGDLAELRFLGIAPGSALLSFGTADLRDTLNIPIQVTRQEASIQVGQPNGVESMNPPLPGAPLVENYPNPFNPGTTIRYLVREPGETRLSVYSMLGQEVFSAHRYDAEGGMHEWQWNGRDDRGNDLAGGGYIVRIQTRATVGSRKVLLVR